MRFQLRKEWVIPSTVGVISFISGVTLGYILGQRRKEKVEVTENIEALSFQVHEGFKKLGEQIEERNTEEGFKAEENDQRMKHKIQELSRVIKKVKNEKEPADEPAEITNIFIRDEDVGWDWEEELAKRNPNHPYIITVDEFEDMRKEENQHWGQETVTYYSRDDILTDSHDSPVYNYRNIVGILDFGHGSGDPSICYTRNEERQCDYEVLLHEEYYQEEVLGAQIDEQMKKKDVRHSSVLKMRDMD